jgi:hypothetical protein
LPLLYIRRFSEFGCDGGPAAKSLKPKFNLFVRQAAANIRMAVPHIDVWIYLSGCFFALFHLIFLYSQSILPKFLALMACVVFPSD